MILVHIASGIDRPADIAREMGLTRQNIHHMARTLIDDGLLEQKAVPGDGRTTYYSFTPGSDEIRAAARETLSYLESVLVKRIGREPVSQLKNALAKDWGPQVTERTARARRKQ
ncbi:MAG: MarR family transcriptional regulator [Gammaproteobacteria bacterium]|nr:MarR family transcriptional regulator [Gammaproteobacteria bacterium]